MTEWIKTVDIFTVDKSIIEEIIRGDEQQLNSAHGCYPRTSDEVKQEIAELKELLHWADIAQSHYKI